jgi:hypothetical protein
MADRFTDSSLTIAGETFLIFASAIDSHGAIPHILLDCVFANDHGIIEDLGLDRIVAWLEHNGFVALADNAVLLTDAARAWLARRPLSVFVDQICAVAADVAVCMLLDQLLRAQDEAALFQVLPVACRIADRAIAEQRPLSFDLASLVGLLLTSLRPAEAERFLLEAVAIYERDPRGALWMICHDLLHLSALALRRGDDSAAATYAASMGSVWGKHMPTEPIEMVKEWFEQLDVLRERGRILHQVQRSTLQERYGQ